MAGTTPEGAMIAEETLEAEEGEGETLVGGEEVISGEEGGVTLEEEVEDGETLEVVVETLEEINQWECCQ